MTAVALRDLTAEEAREKVDTVKALVSDAWTEVADLYRGRAWLALGYTSWDALCDAEFDGARIRLPREERRDVVGSLREAGLSTRAIASAVGISDGTVRSDLSTAQNYAVERVQSLDGRERPATQPRRTAVREERTEPAPPPQAPDPSEPVTAAGAADDAALASPADEYRRRYPTIDRPTVDDAKATEYGTYLDSLDEYERAGRVENLTRTLDNRDAGVKAPQLAEPEAVTAFHRLAEAIVEANSRTSRYRRALPALLDDAKPYVDGMEWGLALSAADDLRGLLADLLDHSQSIPSLRSVR